MRSISLVLFPENPVQKKSCVRQPVDGASAKKKRGRPAKVAAAASYKR